MKNARSQLLGFAAASLLVVPLLGTGCGQPLVVAEGDAQPPPSSDAAGPGSDASQIGIDAGALKVDASAIDAAVELPDAALAIDASTSLDGSSAPEDAAVLSPDAGTAPDTGLQANDDAGEAGPDAGAATCGRAAKSPDRPRKIVLAHPFSSTTPDYKAMVWDVLDLSTTGEVTMPSPRVSVTMGRGGAGEVIFTPDGEIALAPQDDGTIGVLKFDAAGSVQVLQTNWSDGFWVDRMVMDPSGDRFYAIDGEWPNIGGGLYSVRIGCDGTLTNEGRILSAKNPAALAYLPGRAPQAFVFGKEVLTAPALANAHLLEWGPTPTLVGSVTAFPDDDANVSDARVMPDGQWALIADNSMYTVNRVAVVELQSSSVRAVQVLSPPFTDPAQVVPSPYGNAAIVVSGEGNSIHRLTFDASNSSAPFAVAGQIAYLGGAKPQLPLVAVAMQSGNLFGRVYIAELDGIRQVQFETDGNVTDLGLTKFLTSYEAITGAMGIQP